MTDHQREAAAVRNGTAEAEQAREAAAKAAKAEQELAKTAAETRKAEADARKAEAEARSAAATARKDERRAAEQDSPLARARRDAEKRKATAEAEKDAAAAQQAKIAALIPDFSKLDRGTLDIKGDQPLFGAALSRRALAAAAHEVAKAANAALPRQASVLITSDTALATSDAAYHDVMSGLKGLDSAAEQLIGTLVEEQKAGTESFALETVAALAAALPGALSLLSAHRTVTSAAVAAEDLPAAAATAGALKRLEAAAEGGAKPTWTIVHDDVRLLPTDGAVEQQLKSVAGRREVLVSHKLALGDGRESIKEQITVGSALVASLEAKLEEAPDDQREQIARRLDAERAELAGHQKRLAAKDLRIGLVDSVLASIDSFVAALRAVPEGAARSPLTLAILREQLHSNDLTHVLLVKGDGGSMHQVVDDKPLWFKDKFSLVAAADITYMLVKADATSALLAAGTANGTARGHGTIGDHLTFSTEAV